jgi:hypothetical protein
MIRPIYVVLIALSVLAGCATQGVSTTEIQQPSQPAFSYEKHINYSQSEIWDRLVRNMAKSFFVINNIDKESRIINISYSSDKPQEFVDCGNTTRTFTVGDKVETYTYRITDGIATFKVALKSLRSHEFSSHAAIVRKTSLDGRANVYVAPEGSGTLVTVNAKSIVKIALSGEVFSEHMLVGRPFLEQVMPPSFADITAITKGGTENTLVNGSSIEKITCYSTGALEKLILDLTD